MHVILPAIPTVSRAMSAPVPTVQLAVTLFLMVVAFAQLVYGPLSDRFGRKPPLLVGLVIFIAGTLVCAGANSIATLLGGRMLQGLGACSGVVLARAMLRDVYPPDRGAQLQAHMSSIMILLPIFAAMVGGMLVGLIGWRWPFVVLAAVGALLLFRSTPIHETHTGPRAAPGVGRMFADYVALLRLPQFMGSAGAIALMTGCLFSFLTQAPQLFEEGLGIPPSRYGFLLAVIPCGWGVGSFLASRLIPRLGSRRVSTFGARLVFATSFGGLASALIFPLSVPALLVPMVLFNVSQALTVPGLTMQAISANPHRIGAASGLMGFLMMLGGALATRVVSVISDGTELPLGVLIAALGATASLLALWGIRHAAAPRATEVK
jgi:DHA1 family bicyclomycin/chloramphenicol resistance-like MFS transporter